MKIYRQLGTTFFGFADRVVALGVCGQVIAGLLPEQVCGRDRVDTLSANLFTRRELDDANFGWRIRRRLNTVE